MKVTKSKLVIFSVAVAFVSVFFFAYAVQAVYPAPDYEDFCNVSSPKMVQSEVACVEAGGRWTDYDPIRYQGSNGAVEDDIKGRCDADFECREEYDAVRDVYERNVFFANLIIGLLVFVVAFFLGLEAVSSGLMGGALMLIVYGTLRYWGELSDVWRTFILGIVLVVLIWLGYKKLRD